MILTLQMMLRRLFGRADEFVSNDGAWSILLIDGLLLIPVVFAAFFFPWEMLIAFVSLAVLAVVVYEVVHFSRRHQTHWFWKRSH